MCVSSRECRSVEDFTNEVQNVAFVLLSPLEQLSSVVGRRCAVLVDKQPRFTGPHDPHFIWFFAVQLFEELFLLVRITQVPSRVCFELSNLDSVLAQAVTHKSCACVRRTDLSSSD